MAVMFRGPVYCGTGLGITASDGKPKVTVDAVEAAAEARKRKLARLRASATSDGTARKAKADPAQVPFSLHSPRSPWYGLPKRPTMTEPLERPTAPEAIERAKRRAERIAAQQTEEGRAAREGARLLASAIAEEQALATSPKPHLKSSRDAAAAAAAAAKGKGKGKAKHAKSRHPKRKTNSERRREREQAEAARRAAEERGEVPEEAPKEPDYQPYQPKTLGMRSPREIRASGAVAGNFSALGASQVRSPLTSILAPHAGDVVPGEAAGGLSRSVVLNSVGDGPPSQRHLHVIRRGPWSVVAPAASWSSTEGAARERSVLLARQRVAFKSPLPTPSGEQRGARSLAASRRPSRYSHADARSQAAAPPRIVESRPPSSVEPAAGPTAAPTA